MNNFGIVTRFTVRTFEHKELFSGNRVFSADYRDAVVNEAYKLTTTWKNDTSMAFAYGYSYSQARQSFSLTFTEAYTEPILDPPPFETLNSIPFTGSTLKIARMSNFSLEGGAARPPGGR